MCVNNDTIVKWTQRKQQLHLARSGRLSVLASEQGWILQGRSQVGALWAEHERTWSVLNSAVTFEWPQVSRKCTLRARAAQWRVPSYSFLQGLAEQFSWHPT